MEKDALAGHLGIKLLEVKPGFAKATMKITKQLLNGAGVTIIACIANWIYCRCTLQRKGYLSKSQITITTNMHKDNNSTQYYSRYAATKHNRKFPIISQIRTYLKPFNILTFLMNKHEGLHYYYFAD